MVNNIFGVQTGYQPLVNTSKREIVFFLAQLAPAAPETKPTEKPSNEQGKTISLEQFRKMIGRFSFLPADKIKELVTSTTITREQRAALKFRHDEPVEDYFKKGEFHNLWDELVSSDQGRTVTAENLYKALSDPDKKYLLRALFDDSYILYADNMFFSEEGGDWYNYIRNISRNISFGKSTEGGGVFVKAGHKIYLCGEHSERGHMVHDTTIIDPLTGEKLIDAHEFTFIGHNPARKINIAYGRWGNSGKGWFYDLTNKKKLSPSELSADFFSSLRKEDINKCFWGAIEFNDAEMIRIFLDLGVDVNGKDENGNTALMNAVVSDDVNPDVIKLLLGRGADVNVKGKRGSTALQKAVIGENVNLEVIKLLLDSRADVNSRDKGGNTALMNAVIGGILRRVNPEVVKLLLGRGADVNGNDEDGNSVLMSAARGGNLEVARILLDHGADVTTKNKKGANSLQCAAREGNPDIVKLLLGLGADINGRGEFGDTVLMNVALRGNSEVVKLLLDQGVDVDVQDAFGRNAIDYAAESGSVDVIKLLLDRSINVNNNVRSSEPALVIVTKKGHFEIVKLLLDHGADANTKSGTLGHYPVLTEAASSGYLEITKLLLDRGADVEGKNDFGTTVLMEAARDGNPEVVRLLLERGAYVYANNNAGHTALDYAKTEEIRNLLKTYKPERKKEVNP